MAQWNETRKELLSLGGNMLTASFILGGIGAGAVLGNHVYIGLGQTPSQEIDFLFKYSAIFLAGTGATISMAVASKAVEVAVNRLAPVATHIDNETTKTVDKLIP